MWMLAGYRQLGTYGPSRLAWFEGWWLLGELSQWPRHEDSTINIDCGIIIRPHRSTTYVDAAYCYGLSSVVCPSVGLSPS